MKRIYTYLTLLMLALAPAALTSCDDDPWYDDPYGDWYDDYDWYDRPFDHGSSQLVDMAQMLNGTWSGEARNVSYENGVKYETQIGVEFTFAQYTRNSNNGTGYETDYAQRYDADGNPVKDRDGNAVYDTQTLRFKWYIDPRTYSIYMEYDSGYRYLLDYRGNTADSGFQLGWNDEYRRYIFDGVMEGVNTDERVYFSCDRVDGNTRALGSGTAAKRVTFGKTVTQRVSTDGLKSALPKR